jgi:glucosamine--fructose-6-phosphate aminotransferase (isomerizing)
VCGIVGYVGRPVGERQVQQLLLAGLSKLEYRGYDSAGISVICEDRIEAVRAVGNLSALRAKLDGQRPPAAGTAVALAERPATTGIGHTRWATHGRVSEENAHPHSDSDDRVHVVVNGIVENYIALKERLLANGSVFTSETDAEVIAHLIAERYAGDLPDAVRAAYAELDGHYAFVAMSLDEPEMLVGARKECPLIVGREHHHRRRRARRACRADCRLGRGDGREGRLRDVHAEGDPRTGRRRGRCDLRPHRARKRG